MNSHQVHWRRFNGKIASVNRISPRSKWANINFVLFLFIDSPENYSKQWPGRLHSCTQLWRRTNKKGGFMNEQSTTTFCRYYFGKLHLLEWHSDSVWYGVIKWNEIKSESFNQKSIFHERPNVLGNWSSLISYCTIFVFFYDWNKNETLEACQTDQIEKNCSRSNQASLKFNFDKKLGTNHFPCENFHFDCWSKPRLTRSERNFSKNLGSASLVGHPIDVTLNIWSFWFECRLKHARTHSHQYDFLMSLL